MKPIRWTAHALDDLSVREISREEAEQTLIAPDRIAPGRPSRQIYQRQYRDALLDQQMLIRVVVEETELERIIVTLYKTSKLKKYL